MQTMSKASIIYRGPSKIDGKPIVCVYLPGSTNAKTGNMAQTYILADNGLSPMENNRRGYDVSICGNCKHRGTPTPERMNGVAANRSCYVTLHHGPLQVHKGLQRGIYPSSETRQARQGLGKGANVRLGTYGDPAAVPSHIWRDLLQYAASHTGYTHQSETLGEANLSRYMISADTTEQATEAHAQGKRTFRVIPLTEWKAKQNRALLANEILCPASEEAGKRTTCEKCKLCSGQGIKARSIAIPAHGGGKKYA